MLTCYFFVGLFIQLIGGLSDVPLYLMDDPYVTAAVHGGHLHVDVSLSSTVGVQQAAKSVFVEVIGLAQCISPENVRAIDPDTGRNVAFVVVDRDKDGARRWAVKPTIDYTSVRAVIDMDFINKCQISGIAAGEAA